MTLALLAQVQSATLLQPPHIRHLRMLAQVHRVWDPATGQQMGVVPFALANDFTPGIRDSANFDVDIRGAEKSTAALPDASVHASATLFPASPRMSGAFYLPLPSKAGTWRVTAQEGEVITLGFPGERVVAGLNLVQREIDASRLPGSRYRIDVEVFAKEGQSLGKASGMIELVR